MKIVVLLNRNIKKKVGVLPIWKAKPNVSSVRGCLHGGGPALLVGLALFAEISLLTTEISPRRAGNFHINALKRASPP